MKYYWETKEGDRIEFSKIEDSHLLNILKWIEKRAEEGITLQYGGGGWDIDDMWYEEEHLIGKNVLKHFKYGPLLKEALKRDLITQKDYLLKA